MVRPAILLRHGLVIFVFIHALVVPSSGGQLPGRCAQFAKKPEECIAYIGYRVFIPGNATQQDLADTILSDLATAAQIPSPSCKGVWTKYLCGKAFKRCSYADDAKTIAAVHPICRSFCDGISQECQEMILSPEFESELPNCNATSATTGYPEYPTDSNPYPFPLGPNNTVPIRCFTPGKTKDDDLDPGVKCPPHYVPLNKEFDDSKYITPCQRRCPLAIYSEPEYQALSITQIVEGYIGFVTLVLVLIPFFISFSETNAFPSVIPLYMYVSCGLMALGFMWPSFFDGFDNVTCEQDFHVADVTYFPCAVQGILLYWGTASLVLWWCNICLHLFVGSIAGVGYHTKKLRIIYYFLGWFLPTVGLFIAWASTQIGASPTSVNCFLDWDAADGWWANGLFYVEFTIIIIVGFVALNIGVLRLLRSHGLASFHKQGRMIVFAYAFLCIFLFMMIYWWAIGPQRSHYEHATDHWFGCLVARFSAAEKAGHPDGKQFDPMQDYGCVLSERNPFGMLYAQTLIFSAIPFLVAMIFGHSWYTWNTWGTIVCSLLCVAIQSLANPSSLFSSSPTTSSPATSPRVGRRKGAKHRWTSDSLEMDDVESKVKFVALGSDDEDEGWAGDQDEHAVEEGEVGGKGRKRSSTNSSADNDTEGEGDATDDDSDPGHGDDGDYVSDNDD